MGKILIASINTEVPLLPLKWIWLHTCVAISCKRKQISVVVNGVKVLDTHFQEESNPCPTNLKGNLVLQKYFAAAGYWGISRGKVTNVNIFSGMMPQHEMVSRTSGEHCGRRDGDYLSWTNSSWSLHGAAKWTEVSVTDLCLKFPSIQLFSTQRVTKPIYCKRLCQNIHENGRMASVETPEIFGELQSRLRTLTPMLDPDGNNAIIVWLPVLKQNNFWFDIYTDKMISFDWNTDSVQMVNDSKKDCAVGSSTGLINWYCTRVHQNIKKFSDFYSHLIYVVYLYERRPKMQKNDFWGVFLAWPPFCRKCPFYTLKTSSKCSKF